MQKEKKKDRYRDPRAPLEAEWRYFDEVGRRLRAYIDIETVISTMSIGPNDHELQVEDLTMEELELDTSDLPGEPQGNSFAFQKPTGSSSAASSKATSPTAFSGTYCSLIRICGP